MPGKLIETLNANVAKSPDEIVTALTNKGWIAYKHMTQDQYRNLVGKVCVVVADNHPDDQNGGFWRVSVFNENWIYPREWNPATRQGLTEFWFKLLEEYTDGDLPDPSLGRYAGQDAG